MGQAGTVAEIEACVLTQEVAKGGQMINDVREKAGLKPVETAFVDMILAEQDLNDRNYSNKLSSTNIRQYLAN